MCLGGAVTGAGEAGTGGVFRQPLTKPQLLPSHADGVDRVETGPQGQEICLLFLVVQPRPLEGHSPALLSFSIRKIRR